MQERQNLYRMFLTEEPGVGAGQTQKPEVGTELLANAEQVQGFGWAQGRVVTGDSGIKL